MSNEPGGECELNPNKISKVVEEGSTATSVYVVLEGTGGAVPQCEDRVVINEGTRTYFVIDGPAAHGEGSESADRAKELLKEQDDLASLVKVAHQTLASENRPVAFAGIQINKEAGQTQIVSAGDVRVYYLDGQATHMRQLTADHTPFNDAERYLLMLREDDGPVSEEDVYRALEESGFPRNNAHRMNRGLGASKGPQMYTHTPSPDGVYLVVSDGGYKSESVESKNNPQLSANEKQLVLKDAMLSFSKGRKPDEAIRDLRTVLDGAEDDVSIILVKV